MEVGYHFHFSSLAGTNHVVPLNHRGAKGATPSYAVKAEIQKYLVSSANVYILSVSLIYTAIITNYCMHVENTILNGTLCISHFLPWDFSIAASGKPAAQPF